MFERTKTASRDASQWVTGRLTRHPLISFVVLLALLFGLILLGQKLRAPEATPEAKEAPVKATRLFVPERDTALLPVAAEVKKENLIRVVALAPGVVTHVRVAPGKTVSATEPLVELSNDYGSNISALQREIARNQLALERRLARQDEKLFELREDKLEEDNDDKLVTDRTQDIGRVEIKQDAARRDTELKNAALQLAITAQNEATLRPRAFSSGTVERVVVRVGDFVMPGDTLATVRTKRGSLTLEARISPEVARLFNPAQPATLVLGATPVPIQATYFSTEETDTEGLASILFTLSPAVSAKVTDGSFVTLELPLRADQPETFLLPVDAVFQDQERAWVLVEEDGSAVTRDITLGAVTGGFVEALSGIDRETRVILNRAVLAGDKVSIES